MEELVERIGYHLDLADEKKIGKAKVVCDVVTREEAFASIIKLQKNEKDKIHGEAG